MAEPLIPNPFRPGAGHMPLYLAGREDEKNEFRKLLRQKIILDNLILTGLRGVGKTVLLETMKIIAIQEGWLWVGTDLTEATSLSEERVVIRTLADLAVVTSSIKVRLRQRDAGMGFRATRSRSVRKALTFDFMREFYEATPGLALDKLKAVLEFAWEQIESGTKAKGLIFAYDEAQNMSDKSDHKEFPLSLMLDLFQSIQRKNLPVMLVMTGLPTLQPKLVQARTFAERMFRVLFLDGLDEAASRDAIRKPGRHPQADRAGQMPDNAQRRLDQGHYRGLRRLPLFHPVHLSRGVRRGAAETRRERGPADVDSRYHAEARHRFFCRPLGQGNRPAARVVAGGCGPRRMRSGILGPGSRREIEGPAGKAVYRKPRRTNVRNARGGWACL
jgi:hypothetical protein